MGILKRLFGKSEQRSADYMPTVYSMFGASGFSDSGVTITEDNALIASAVFACCSVIAQTISPLPAKVFNRDTKEEQRGHSLAPLIQLSPNEFMSAVTFLETMLFQASLWGAAYSVIVRDEFGNVSEMYPLNSGTTRPIRINGKLYYESIIIGQPAYYFTPDQIFFVLGWSLNGVTPISPVRSARQAIGLSVAMERYSAKAFSGSNVGGILQLPPGMGDDQMKKFVDSWRERYAGIDNAFRVAVLPDPIKFVPTSMDPERAQLSAARQDQILDVARYWRVPPHMLGILDKSSYSSIEAQNIAFYQQTILHWLTKVEQEFRLKCLLTSEQDTLEVKFTLDNLLRPATSERFAAYMSARQAGWITTNEIRKKENLPPIDGGDVILQPLNMGPMPTGSAANPATPTTPPAPVMVRSLVEDAAKRLLTKEAKALTRAVKKFAGKPTELRAWADTFYQTHSALVQRVMSAPIKAAGCETTADAYAKTHCTESQRAIIAAGEAGGLFDDLTDEWETIRAAEIADQLTNEKGANQ